MKYQQRGTEMGEKRARRGLAFLIDLALVLAVVFALERDKFSGAPAALFLIGVYRVVAHGAFNRSLGKAVTGLVVEPDAETPKPGSVRTWWWSCVVRELVFYGLPGLVLLVQLALELGLNSVVEGLVLVVVVCVLGAELPFLVIDAGVASARDGRALHDRIAGTLVRRSA